jgi:hypothetical protein
MEGLVAHRITHLETHATRFDTLDEATEMTKTLASGLKVKEVEDTAYPSHGMAEDRVLRFAEAIIRAVQDGTIDPLSDSR